jgi:hypothetical protein
MTMVIILAEEYDTMAEKSDENHGIFVCDSRRNDTSCDVNKKGYDSNGDKEQLLGTQKAVFAN